VKYRTIVADPPWRADLPGISKANPSKQYSLMSLEHICALPVASIAEDQCHLWLWAVNIMMGQAHAVVRAWGFRPVTVLTWCKPGPGVGRYLRNNTEHAILAYRGKAMYPDRVPLSTWYRWPRQPHSQKPDAFYDLVETVSPEPRVELFARRHRLFWDVWGNESANTASLEPGDA
jgi:N6-adenosine-specific RNA methylase IME4